MKDYNFFKNKISASTNQYLIGALISFIVSLFVIIVFAFITTLTDVGELATTIFGIISLSIGGFSGAYFTGAKLKKGGMKIGVIIGLSLFVTTFLLGLIFNGIYIDILSLIKMLSILICSVAAGVLSVNNSAKRRMK